MTVATEDLVDSASIAAASTKRKSLWRLALRNPNVIIGGAILLIMLAIAALAPLLGTVDPTRIDPASRNKKPGTEITMRLDDGTDRQARRHHGHRQPGPRRLQPRHLRHARVAGGRRLRSPSSPSPSAS